MQTNHSNHNGCNLEQGAKQGSPANENEKAADSNVAPLNKNPAANHDYPSTFDMDPSRSLDHWLDVPVPFAVKAGEP